MKDRWLCCALTLAIVSSLVSIFASGLFFSVTILLWLLTCVRSRRITLQSPPFATVLLLFVGAVLVSVACSTDISSSAKYLMKLIKFLYPFLVFTYLTRSQVERTLQAIFVVLGASAVYGILQYYWLMDVHLLNRISGFMGNWMTFSGQLMLGAVALAAYVLFNRLGATEVATSERAGPSSEEGLSCGEQRRGAPYILRWVWLALLFVLLLALVLTLTRNAWLGFGMGLFIVLAIYRFSWALMALVLAGVVFLTLPFSFQQRLYSAFDLEDETLRGRLVMLQTGRNMIAAHPWTGVGPRMVRTLSPRYRTSDEFPEWIYQHLHNNVVQIGAEMGLIGLSAWGALWIRVLWDLGRFIRRGRRSACDPLSMSLSVSGVGVLAAFLFGGLFEYNFGDSEILILLLFLVTAPYVVNRPSKTA